MEILDASQIRAWDQFTIAREPIASIDLMERAALACMQWLNTHMPHQEYFKIFCGKGNNGGDGLAMARLLIERGKKVSVYILEFGKPGSDDFQVNLQRLHVITDKIIFIQTSEHFPLVSTDDVVIDALFGTGLHKPLEGLAAQLVDHLNHSTSKIISIDLPSGMLPDRSISKYPVVRALHTLTFQCWKLCFLAAENEDMYGNVHILPIGLNPQFLKEITVVKYLTDKKMVAGFYKKRKRSSHKGNFGHCLIAGGSYGKMGAMVLAIKACVHTGAGLTTAFIPRSGYPILQTTVPEAMVIAGEPEEFLSGLPEEIEKFNCIGTGPGMGTAPDTINMLSFLIRRYGKPMVIDADGLNCLAKQPALLQHLPPLSILTPHPKEFDRLFGEHDNEFDRWKRAEIKAAELNVILLVKGHYTQIALPSGEVFFNNTGNPGMAKGGSGDVLTGILVSLLSQGYEPKIAAIMGVYLHGLAGDFAAHALTEECMVASDIIEFLPQAFKVIQ